LPTLIGGGAHDMSVFHDDSAAPVVAESTTTGTGLAR
jgi:hypothetical protein